MELTKESDVQRWDQCSPEKLDDETPIKVACILCDHTWIVAYLPMNLEIFAKIVGNAHCPRCGADSSEIAIGVGESDG